MLNRNIDQKEIIDWVELYVALEGGISKTFLLSNFDELNEEDIENIYLGLSGRLYLYGDLKPYKIEGDMVIGTVFASPHIKAGYVFTVILSVFGNGELTNIAGKLFEKLSNEAFQEYLGGKSTVFGFPDGTTPSIDIKIDDLAVEINEKRGNQNPPVHSKDCKLDLISYHGIDSRENKLIILVQSASGKNWKDKLNELSIQEWRYYINFSSEPVRGFSTPLFIDEKEAFWHNSIRAGILFDRPRIYNFISRRPDFRDTSLGSELNTLNTQLLAVYNP